MLPKWHVIISGIFVVLLQFFFDLAFFQTSLIFLASILIDFDHYLVYIKKMKNLSLKKAYFWNKTLLKHHNPIIYIFHTAEFLFLVFILSFFWQGFFFILIGMLFHLVSDIIDMIYEDDLNSKEFSLINYLISNKKLYLGSI